jgi:transposase
VLTRLRTAVKNRVHALLARQGILPEHTDLFGRSGREFLADLELPEGSRRRLDSLMSLICDFDREITATTREIDARAKADERVPVLCQLPGVGRYTAMLIIAEVGDVTRFPTARHLCAGAGLAPTVRSSDGKARLGHISRQGSPALRWALTEAAQKLPTGGGPLRAMFERIAKRRGRNTAKVAVARQILTLCYYGLRDGEIRCLKHQPAIDDHDNHELAEAA